MTSLQSIPCPRPTSPMSTLVLCYGCNEYFHVANPGYWCARCKDAAAAVHAKLER